jgi:hypothetical protein
VSDWRSIGVAVDGQPDVGQLPVLVGVDGVEAGTLESDAENAVGGPVELQVGKGRIEIRHGRSVFSAARSVRNSVCGVDIASVGGPNLPEPRTCEMCGVTREDVSEVSYYDADRVKQVSDLCADCKARHLVRRRKSRRPKISRSNRAVEVAGLTLVVLGILVLVVVIVGAIATRI